jgi:GT2 family glycosyltransferase
MTRPAPKFSFVVVTYNSEDTIEPCLASVASLTRDSWEIVVVDNSPSVDTFQAVQRFIADHPGLPVQLLRPDENIGFGRGCNLGAKHTTGEYLFFLNPDTQLMNDAAGLLAERLEANPKVWAAGPAIFDSDGQVTRTCRNLPNLGHIILDATGLDKFLGAYKLTRFGHDQPSRVEQIIGAAILMPRTFYQQLGGMDEQFFIYFEEVDLCKRLKDAGGEIWFWPEARVQHLAGRSCEVDTVRARMIYILRESRKKYFVKHFGTLGGWGIEAINRLEALEKILVLNALWLLRRKRSYREKASGFWAVAMGVAPRT